jgi:hypothetical protein
VLHKHLKLCAYKLQLLHEVKPDDKPKHATFAADILQHIETGNNFLAKVLFSDEATFHLSGMVNRHNMRIWGTEHPREVVEYQRDIPRSTCGVD